LSNFEQNIFFTKIKRYEKSIILSDSGCNVAVRQRFRAELLHDAHWLDRLIALARLVQCNPELECSDGFHTGGHYVVHHNNVHTHRRR